MGRAPGRHRHRPGGPRPAAPPQPRAQHPWRELPAAPERAAGNLQFQFGDTENKQGAAPLALRLWATSILLTMQPDRHGNHPAALETPLRQLRAELHPGPRKPRPSGYWPLLMRAAEALDSMEARAPWRGPGTKRGGLRRVAPVGDIPGGSGSLDDQVRIIADLPPGSGSGRQAPDNLAHWGPKPGRA